MNIGANWTAHGKRTVSTKQSQMKDLTVASRLCRGIELFFKSLNCFTVRPIFSTRPISRMKSFSLFFCFVLFCFLRGEGVVVVVLSSNAFTIWCCIPISRPPRVIRCFKRRSCYQVTLYSLFPQMYFFTIPERTNREGNTMAFESSKTFICFIPACHNTHDINSMRPSSDIWCQIFWASLLQTKPYCLWCAKWLPEPRLNY